MSADKQKAHVPCWCNKRNVKEAGHSQTNSWWGLCWLAYTQHFPPFAAVMPSSLHGTWVSSWLSSLIPIHGLQLYRAEIKIETSPSLLLSVRDGGAGCWEQGKVCCGRQLGMGAWGLLGENQMQGASTHHMRKQDETTWQQSGPNWKQANECTAALPSLDLLLSSSGMRSNTRNKNQCYWFWIWF